MKGGEGRGAGSECLQWVELASKRVIHVGNWVTAVSDEGEDKKKKQKFIIRNRLPGGAVVKNLLCNARDMGLIPGQGLRPHMPLNNLS